MSTLFKRFMSLTVLLTWVCSFVIADDCSSSCSACPKGCVQSQNLVQLHPFSASMGREMLHKQAAFRKDSNEGWQGVFGVTGEYQSTLGAWCGKTCCSKVNTLPFWSADNSNVMTVGNNSGLYDVDAYQFGLGPVTTNGTVALNTKIYQAGADFSFYLGAHQQERGFFLFVHGPVGVVNVNTRLTVENDVTPVVYPEGALATSGTEPAAYSGIAQAFRGEQSAGFLQAMKYGKFYNGKETSSAKFGDLEVAVGYNMIADEYKHLGLGVRFSAPTGNKARGEFVQEPIFGRNGHWGLGGEILGHWDFWTSDDSEKSVCFWFDGEAMHLFKSKHMRSFDLAKNGKGSKYLLLAKYNDTTFQSEIVNAVDITTIGIQSTFAVEGNFAVAFDFNVRNWTVGIGYEGWGRTCEKIHSDSSCSSVDLSGYAVLGRQQPFSTTGSVLNLCQPNAMIGKSEDYATAPTTTILDATDVANRLSPIVNVALDIDAQNAAAVYTSKPYAALTYTWKDSSYAPYVGVKGGAEISQGESKSSAANFWHFSAHAGLTF